MPEKKAHLGGRKKLRRYRKGFVYVLPKPYEKKMNGDFTTGVYRKGGKKKNASASGRSAYLKETGFLF